MFSIPDQKHRHICRQCSYVSGRPSALLVALKLVWWIAFAVGGLIYFRPRCVAAATLVLSCLVCLAQIARCLRLIIQQHSSRHSWAEQRRRFGRGHRRYRSALSFHTARGGSRSLQAGADRQRAPFAASSVVIIWAAGELS